MCLLFNQLQRHSASAGAKRFMAVSADGQFKELYALLAVPNLRERVAAAVNDPTSDDARELEAKVKGSWKQK